MIKAKWSVLPLVSLLLLNSGCSEKPTPHSSASLTPATTPSPSFDRSAVYHQATSLLQSFLDSWKKGNSYDASRKYLDRSMWPAQKEGNPVLISGSVKRVQPSTWLSADHFTLMVDFDFQFSGNAGAWGNGVNTRFVTFVRTSPSAPFRMNFTTSP